MRQSIRLKKMNSYTKNLVNAFRSMSRRRSEPSRARFILCLLVTILFYLTTATNTATAATYYLDAVNGSDTNTGTSELPWKTISKAQSSVVGGDTVIMRNGEYGGWREDNISHSGWITYKAAEGHSPEVTRIWLTSDNPWTDSHLIFDGLTVTSISEDDAIRLQYVTHVQFLNCNIVGNGFLLSDWENKGFNLRQGVKDITIDNCTIHGAGDGYLSGFTAGVTMSSITYVSENISITNCDISECSLGIFVDGNNINISNNDIHKLVSDGIVFENVNGYTIENNKIHDIELYTPTLVETPTETTWSADGKTMTNPNAKWNTSGNNLITTGMELYINNGEHCLTGDQDNSVVTVVSDTEITWNKSIKSGTETPHNVDYNIHSSVHADLIQAQPNDGGAYNVTIRNNQLYDSLDAWSFMHLEPSHDGPAGFNWLIENNLCWNVIGSHNNQADHPINLRYMNGLVFRNNIVIGKVQIRYNATDTVTFVNNIVGVIDIYDTAGLVKNDYNIIRNGSIASPFSIGGHSTAIGYVSGTWVVGADYDDSSWLGIFVNSNGGDLQHASATSLGVGHGDPTNYPSTDILGATRDINPDAGCYEYISQGNNAPVLQAIGDKSVNENSALSFSVSATDADIGDAITYSATGLPSGSTFTPATKTFSWTPDYTQAGSYQVTFTANDGTDQDSETITITVSNTNRAPLLDSIGDKSVSENSTLSFPVSATDADSDTVTYSASGTAIDADAALSGQSFSWTPGYTQAGTYQVTFTANDGTDQDSETITITVSNTNRAPVFDSIGDKSVSENSTLSFPVSATDADSDSIAYSVTGDLPSGAVFGNQTFTWTPGYTQAGTYQVTFTASDGTASDSETITIIVSNTNRAPELSSIGDKSVYTENSLTFTVSATDADSDIITYSASGTAIEAGAALSGQSFSWTPGSGQAGSYNVTFTARDSETQDSETITITVTADLSAPTVTNLSPAADSIQVPLNSLIYLDVADSGKGVNASTVTIKVNSNLVYTADTTDYSSSYGRCRRIGTSAAYTYVYQADETFDYGQTVTVTVNATDLASNPMDEYSYLFKTEMRSFGKNKTVESSSDNLNEGSPATASDSSGNIWAVWHTGQTGSRDIYAAKLTAGADDFGGSVKVTNDTTDQCNPVIAIDSTGKPYVAWQDNRNGEWDIYVSTSTDGTSFSTERKITDPNSNQINPAIVIDSSNKAYIVWEDDRNNNKDIYIASSSDSFVSYATSRITSNDSEQIAPAIAVDSGNTVYVVWTDARGGTSDIYGADSTNGPWTNAAVVSNANNQSSPAIAAEASGTILHFLWVDNTSGDSNIYYASSSGLPSSSLTGSSLIDDSSGADQSAPAIIVTGSTGNSLKVFACWKDERNVSSGNGDTDIYFVEVNSDSKTNVLVGDDSTNSAQSYPAMGIDRYGYPYIAWTDNRNTSTNIYYAGSTFVESAALESVDIVASSGATVGTELASISSATDVSVTIPAGASLHDVTITISRVKNPQKITLERFSIPYDFGPSGLEFSQPVTIIIPYDVSTVGNSPSAYWYNPLTSVLSQQGITDVETIEISSSLHALRFKTTHFTQFLVGGGIAAAIGGGGGGGGCSMSPNSQGSIVEFLLPYIGLTMVMIILKLRDKQKKTMRNITGSG